MTHKTLYEITGDIKDVNTLLVSRKDWRAVQSEAAYEAGWTEAANWANRSDLISDIGSPAYLKDRMARIGLPVETEVWIVVLEYTWYHTEGARPDLAYLLPAEFGRTTFGCFEDAVAFISSNELPIGWVAMKLTVN